MIKQFSKPGEHHCFDSMQNQDAIAVAKDKRYIAISLADGVSTCSEGKRGADIACKAINTLLKQNASFFFRFDKTQIAEIALTHIFFRLNKQAKQDGQDVAAYSSTISSVLIDAKQKKAILINLGDGIIIGTSREAIKVLAMPGDSTGGCYVTTTKNAISKLDVQIIDIKNMDSITICSDGAWKEMFCKTRIKPEISHHLLHHEFDRLEHFLERQNCFDDYSFVCAELETTNWRQSA